MLKATVAGAVLSLLAVVTACGEPASQPANTPTEEFCEYAERLSKIADLGRGQLGQREADHAMETLTAFVRSNLDGLMRDLPLDMQDVARVFVSSAKDLYGMLEDRQDKEPTMQDQLFFFTAYMALKHDAGIMTDACSSN